MIFEKVTEANHEQVCFCYDQETDLRAIIAIHDSTLGQLQPSGVRASLGGTRRRFYKSEDAALEDALRLSEGMTYKSAAADLELGGAKSVVLLKSKEEEKNPTEREAIAMGKAIKRFGGRYVAAEDMNVTVQYVDWMAEVTKYVIGGKTRATGGDPSPYTARGVINGIKGGLTYATGSNSLSGVTIAVQGLGSIGYKIAKMAAEQGAKLIVTDTRKDRVDKFVAETGARAVNPDDILAVECDVLCPCAIGQVINDNTIEGLKCRLLAPGANNVLDRPSEHAAALKSRGIVYSADFINNAGGVIRLGGLWVGLTEKEINDKVDRIEQRVVEILKNAETMDSSYDAALAYAKKRIDEGVSRGQAGPSAQGRVGLSQTPETIRGL